MKQNTELEKDPHKHSQLTFEKDTRQVNGNSIVFSTNGTEKLDTHWQKKKKTTTTNLLNHILY